MKTPEILNERINISTRQSRNDNKLITIRENKKKKRDLENRCTSCPRLIIFCYISYTRAIIYYFLFARYLIFLSIFTFRRKAFFLHRGSHLIILIITNQVNLMLASSFCLSVSLFVHLFIYPFKHASSLLSLPHCLSLPISRPISIFLYFHIDFFLYMRMILNFDNNER